VRAVYLLRLLGHTAEAEEIEADLSKRFRETYDARHSAYNSFDEDSKLAHFTRVDVRESMGPEEQSSENEDAASALLAARGFQRGQ